MSADANILDAVHDPNLFGPWFERGEWAAWQAFLAALFGLPMDSDQQRIYEACTGRTEPPTVDASEAWLVVGRRGGKSFITALIAVWLAAFHDYNRALQPGERGAVLILAADRKQSRVIYRYIRSLVLDVPMLAALVERETAEGIDLTTGVSIEIATASFRSIRGYTVVAALLDEVAYWRSDGANPDGEVLNALRPGMATIPNAKLIALSSPYSKSGELYRAYRKHYAQQGSVLVWQADTRTMNPTVPERVITEAYERDAEAAKAEYGAQFRSDLEQFVAREVVEACTMPGTVELPYLSGHRYNGFTDPSGGSRDSMTLAIAHNEDGVTVVDAIRERKPPFSPEAVVSEFADLLADYRIATVSGDRYAGEWPRESFRRHRITYDVATKPRSDLYRDMLPALNSKKLALPDDSRLISQVAGLERRTSRGGRDSIDHPSNGHDDVANAVAGVLSLNHGPSATELWEKLID